jgi:hypothetical protein
MPIQGGQEDHPASCTMGTESLSRSSMEVRNEGYSTNTSLLSCERVIFVMNYISLYITQIKVNQFIIHLFIPNGSTVSSNSIIRIISSGELS